MDEKIIKKVWEKATPVSGKDSSLYRQDTHGNVIYYPSYGKTSEMAWMITKCDGRKHLDENNLQAISKHNKKAETKKTR